MNEIFASVASLDERDTPATVRDLVDKASRSIRAVVVLQSDNAELAAELREIPEVELVHLALASARGPVYARFLANARYEGERWFYQCDAHTRHLERWDDIFIEWIDSIDEDKPIISTYAPPSFYAGSTSYIVPLYWDADGLHVSRRDGYRPGAPVPARFLGGGQIFAPGRYVYDVPYDPGLYFHGEEQSQALRSWVAGWRIYHPAHVVTWYSNPQYPDGRRPTHWGLNRHSWGDLQGLSAERMRMLFGWRRGNLGPYGVTREELAAWTQWSGCHTGDKPAERRFSGLESDADWRARHGYAG